MHPTNITNGQELLAYMTASAGNPQECYDRMTEWQQQAHEADQRVQLLERELQAANTQNQMLRQEASRLHAQLQQNADVFARARQQTATGFGFNLRPPPAARVHDSQLFQQQTTRLSEKIADPDIFTGDKTKFLLWRGKIRNKLTQNRDRFPEAQKRIHYVMSRLDGEAYLQVCGYIRDGGYVDVPTTNEECDYEDLLRALERAFGDPNRNETASRELYDLRQTNKPFRQYAARFQRLCTELGGEPMDLSAIGTRPIPSKPRHITQEQYQQRLQTGVCINCGAAGHRRAQCPQRRNDGSFIKLNTTGVEENQHTTSNEEN
ncbi:hypothetical protein B0A49_10924 [Neofusicoccum parvum]|uniref:Uncharacterized protein n=1 Tax=Neofusicoccum parvum TaxID=310453 RepID=A0ACB5SPW1_9PEZI|nr:hypothetical protein B0A49_10924 [Neofusicoccum parvum]